ncbi:Uu.00g034780.m01.CDS01 [Anthostomella pinea]|uniref:Uu.00g034780.m01.CDS01 n=1 Tax=Anthostomella pinea TaxID=933095 RepID=A0AAI8YDD3_9PEZI|nr:Uu.00g034780.m01.CDS01 [Anthostomella pinea]
MYDATDADTSNFMAYLRVFLTHPMWSRDLGRLRYVLQMAVSVTVEGHVDPICSGPAHEESVGDVWPHLSSQEDLGKLQCRDYLKDNSGRDPAMGVVTQLNASKVLGNTLSTLAHRVIFKKHHGDSLKKIRPLDFDEVQLLFTGHAASETLP